MKMTTLCYIEKDGRYLMLHRTKKEKDINKGKWIGVGGHAYDGETPEECLLREVKEETGLTLTSYKFRGQNTKKREEREGLIRQKSLQRGLQRCWINRCIQRLWKESMIRNHRNN